MKKAVRKGLIGLLAAVLLVSGGFALKTALEYRQEAQIYETAQETFVTVVEPTVEATPSATTTAQSQEQIQVEEEEVIFVPSLVPGIAVDLAALKAVNGDAIGWIHIPDTRISYPLLQGEDNQYYVTTAYDGRASSAGSIFADFRVPGDFTAPNTVLYGHNMKSNTMFGDLQEYTQADFFAIHPYFFILTEAGYLRYEICYALYTEATSTVYDYDFAQAGTFAAHLSMLAKRSLYTTGVVPTAADTIVTLSTCTSNTETQRFVIVGRLAETVSN